MTGKPLGLSVQPIRLAVIHEKFDENAGLSRSLLVKFIDGRLGIVNRVYDQ